MTRPEPLDDATAEALLAGGGPPELAHVAAFMVALRTEGSGAVPRPSAALSSLLASGTVPTAPTAGAPHLGRAAKLGEPIAAASVPSTPRRLARLAAGLAGAGLVAKASIGGVVLAAAVTAAGAAGMPVAEDVVDAVVDVVMGRDREDGRRGAGGGRGHDEVARTHAEQRQVEAEQRRIEAEQRRIDATDAERRAQLLRAEAEQRRARAEQARAEAARIGDEAAVAAAESAEQRARADEQQATADQLRAEAKRREAEANEQRAAAEELQAEAELRRAGPGSGSAPAGTPSPTGPPPATTASTSPPPAVAPVRP